MIITRRFIFVHMPRTGGLWVKKAVRQLHLAMFFKQTPLGELLWGVGRLVPSMRPTIYRLAKNLVHLRYKDYDLAQLSIKNYHIYPGKYGRLKQWLVFLAEALFILDRNYETMLDLRRHTRLAQLPPKFDSLPLVGGIRDPFSWHLSRYRYYKHHQTSAELSDSLEFVKVLEHLEDFNDYCSRGMLQLQNGFYQGYYAYIKQHNLTDPPGYHDELLAYWQPGQDEVPPVQHYGLMTLRFMQIYLRRPQQVLSLTPAEFSRYWSSGAYKDNLPEITFLEQEQVTEKLLALLQQLKYKDKLLKVIKDLEPTNVSYKSVEGLSSYYAEPQLIQLIYDLERPIFLLFPQYEKLYQKLLRQSKARN